MRMRILFNFLRGPFHSYSNLKKIKILFFFLRVCSLYAVFDKTVLTAAVFPGGKQTFDATNCPWASAILAFHESKRNDLRKKPQKLFATGWLRKPPSCKSWYYQYTSRGSPLPVSSPCIHTFYTNINIIENISPLFRISTARYRHV